VVNATSVPSRELGESFVRPVFEERIFYAPLVKSTFRADFSDNLNGISGPKFDFR